MADVDSMDKKVADLMKFKSEYEPMLRAMRGAYDRHTEQEREGVEQENKALQEEINKPLPPVKPLERPKAEPLGGGQDRETDDSLRQRLLDHVTDDASYDIKNRISNADSDELDQIARENSLERETGPSLQTAAGGQPGPGGATLANPGYTDANRPGGPVRQPVGAQTSMTEAEVLRAGNPQPQPSFPKLDHPPQPVDTEGAARTDQAPKQDPGEVPQEPAGHAPRTQTGV